MKAALYHGRRDIRFEDIAKPVPAEHELLLQITSVGICGTDGAEYAAGPKMFPIEHLHGVTGHCGPMVPGHEFAGIVASTGAAVAGFSEGDLVTSGAGISCGHCACCLAGRTNLCELYATVGLQRNGALAEFTTVPAACCANVEQRALTSDVAAMAQPMAIAVHAARRGRLQRDDHVVVLGTGGIGAFLVHAAVKAGARVTAVDLDERRLAVAASLGAEITIHVSRDTPLLDQLAGRGLAPTVVYECTGTAPVIEAAIALTARGGRVVVVGLQEGEALVDLLSVALQEKELVGTLAHVFGADFGHAVDLLEDGVDLWSEVAPSVLPLEDLVDRGLEPMIRGDPTPIKVLLDPRIEAPRPMRTKRGHQSPR